MPTEPVPPQPAPPPWAAPPTTGYPSAPPGPPVPGIARPGTPYPTYGAGVPTGAGGGAPGGGPVRPARPGSVGAIVAAVVVLLVLVVAGVAVTALRRSGPEPTTALPTATVPPSLSPTTLPPTTSPGSTDGTSSSSQPAPSSSVPPSGGPRTTATPPPVSASRPGWTAVAGRELVAYDVPSGWKALSPGTLTGFETSGGPKQLVIMHNAAAYQDDACPKASSSSRGQAGFVSWKGQSPSTVAREVSRQWATVAGTQDDDGSVMPLSSTSESRTTVAGGTIPATVATTTLTLEDQPSCAAPRIDFTAVSFQVKGQPVIFMLYLDRGVADEVTTADRDAIIASLRPV